ncbi:MAG: DUF2064 domain-containing protein [Desulfobacteraceae bacterium]|nr:DUF2064 domain-containing protein [Desulfobacteraceae bacterium]
MEQLIIFGRYPVPGKTKTRLIPLLGSVGAADLHRRLTESIWTSAVSLDRLECTIVFCYDGGTPKKVAQWIGEEPLVYKPQSKGNLGQRMFDAMTAGFKGGAKRVVLVGTDIPDIRRHHLDSAFEALASNDLVLGPSTDGGYWLVGLRRPVNVFENIQWGSPNVLKQTLLLAEDKALSHHLLDQLTDIDEPDDLRQFVAQSEIDRPYISVIIPALNEAEGIARTISMAADPNAEIIVVDGQSSDHTVAEATAGKARVLTAPRGRARQLNAGARQARGQVLLFLHADTRLPENYIHWIFDALLDKSCVMGAFRFGTDSSRLGMRIIEFAANIRSVIFKLPYGDQAFFMKRSQFERSGGFPEVPIAEDLFFARRMAVAGNINITAARIITSARRWERVGILRTTLINYLIAAGCIARISPQKLAPLYRRVT